MKKLIGAMIVIAGLLALASCMETPEKAPAAAAKPLKVEITPASFGCIRKMTPVRGFYVSNLLGDTAATVKVANSPTGGVYPVGSLIQLVPGEAMVKREPGFNPATKDWEYFELDVAPAGASIHVRGATEVVNRFGGSCQTCHAQAKAEFDMICESTHGCAPIPITPIMAKAIQNTDPRCEAIPLPPEQQEALKQLAAFMAAAAAPKK